VEGGVTDLPVTLYRAESLVARSNPGAWQAVFPHLRVARRPETADSVREDRVAVWKLGDMALTVASLSAVEIRRPLAAVRSDGHDAVDLTVLSKGAWVGRAGGRALTVGPGELVALDLGQPFEIAATACECVTVSLARTALANAVPAPGDLHGHVFQGAGGALLTDHCLSIARHVDRMRMAEVPYVRAALLAQVAAAATLIRPEEEEARPGVVRMQHQARRYIDQHLTDEDLGAEAILAALGVSRSVLYRAFKDSGGIDAYIRHRRLQAVHALLLLPTERRSIGELAQTFGFSRPYPPSPAPGGPRPAAAADRAAQHRRARPDLRLLAPVAPRHRVPARLRLQPAPPAGLPLAPAGRARSHPARPTRPRGRPWRTPQGRAMTQIPSLHFDTQTLPPGTGFRAFQAAIPHYEVGPAPGTTEAEFAGRSTAWFLGDLILLHSRFTAFNLARTPARIQADGIDTYGFIVLPRGSWLARTESHETTVGPGQLVGVDMTQPYWAEASACEAVHLVVGRATLQAAVRGSFDIAAHVFEGTGGALLTDYLLSLARHIAAMRPEEADAIRKATVAQIAAAVAQVPPREVVPLQIRNVRSQVQRYVDRNLTEPGLTPERIVEELGLSRSTLYRHFEAYGGIQAYIQRRRLQAVHALLLHPDEERSIGELAQTFGFSRASHFTTVFQRTFGCTPRLLRSGNGRRITARSARDAAEAPEVFRDWIQEVRLR
jgi:AraC-like DNA-binding protein